MSDETRRALSDRNDIKALINDLLPDTVRSEIDGEAEWDDTGAHWIPPLITALWSHGACTPMPRPRLLELLAKYPGCTTALEPNSQRKRVSRMVARKRIARINCQLKKHQCKYYAWIAYERSTETYQLIIDSDKVSQLQARTKPPRISPDTRKHIDIDIVSARRKEDGWAVLKPDDVIRCTLKVPLSGYLYLFHVDRDGNSKSLFPAIGAKTKVDKIQDRCLHTYPEDFIEKGFWFKVVPDLSNPKVLQRLVAVVSPLCISWSDQDFKEIGVPAITKGVELVVPTLSKIPKCATAFGEVHYWQCSA